MAAWWRGLTGRERSLFLIAGGLVLLLAIFQFVITPLRAERDDARAALRQATDTWAEVRAGAEFVVAQRDFADPVAQDPAGLRGSLMTSATARGLAITRLQPGDDGLTVRFDNVDPATLYAWISELASDRAVRIRRATVRRVDRGDGVQATLVLVEGAAS